MNRSAALVDAAAGALEPACHRKAVVLAAQPLLLDAAEEKDLVVHREAEEDAEHQDGDEAVNHAGALEPQQILEVAPLEDEDQHPIGGADREHVHQDGLQWEQRRAEHH
jgi:hypothetical protein